MQTYEIRNPTIHQQFTVSDSATFNPPFRRIIPQASGVLVIVDTNGNAFPYVVTAGQPIDLVITAVKQTGSSGGALAATHIGHI